MKSQIFRTCCRSNTSKSPGIFKCCLRTNRNDWRA